jgi:hypothetical protein
MSFDANAFELGEAFMGPPPTYQLELPAGWRLRRLIWQAGRAVRRGQVFSFTLEFIRPLSDETGFVSVAEVDEQDYAHVGEDLLALLAPRGMAVGELTLCYGHKVHPGHGQDPYDVVKATVTVVKASS